MGRLNIARQLLSRIDSFSTSGKRRVRKTVKKNGKTFSQTFWENVDEPAKETKSNKSKAKKEKTSMFTKEEQKILSKKATTYQEAIARGRAIIAPCLSEESLAAADRILDMRMQLVEDEDYKRYLEGDDKKEDLAIKIILIEMSRENRQKHMQESEKDGHDEEGTGLDEDLLEINRLKQEMSKIDEEFKGYDRIASKNSESIYKEGENIEVDVDKLIGRISELHGLTKEKAVSVLQDIDTSSTGMLQEQIKSDTLGFLQMFGKTILKNNLPRCEKIGLERGRFGGASYNDEIVVNPDYAEAEDGHIRKVLFHEFGHQAEDAKRLARVSFDYLEYRSKGVTIRHVFSHKGDFAFGNFENIYTGRKYYVNDQTEVIPTNSEVISTGLEVFADKKRLKDYIKKDLDHLCYVLGAIS